MLGVFRHQRLWRPLFTLARLFRGTGLPRAFAGGGRVGFGMGMLAAVRRMAQGREAQRHGGPAAHGTRTPAPRKHRPWLRADRAPAPSAPAPTVALFRGCVMDTLFRHVHEATRRTLEANGYRVVEVDGADLLWGAARARRRPRRRATALALQNLAAFAATRPTTSW